VRTVRTARIVENVMTVRFVMRAKMVEIVEGGRHSTKLATQC
jgi:hypothetical protein